MKNNFLLLPLGERPSFTLSQYNKIDAKKYTLFDVLTDPKLDKLDISERLRIFNSWHDDLEINRMANYRRYSLNGNSTERIVFDPSSGQTLSMINFGSNDYLNMSQHPSVIQAGAA